MREDERSRFGGSREEGRMGGGKREAEERRVDGDRGDERYG